MRTIGDRKNALIDYWKQNIENNLKTISALIFIIVSKMLGIIFLGLRLGLDWLLIFIILEVSLEPFIIVWLRVIFTGEVAASEVEKRILQEQLAYERELSEYKVRLAGYTGKVDDSIRANKDWTDTNQGLTNTDPQ